MDEPILAPRATLATNLRPNVILYLLPSLSQIYPLPIEPKRVSDHGTEEYIEADASGYFV